MNRLAVVALIALGSTSCSGDLTPSHEAPLPDHNYPPGSASLEAGTYCRPLSYQLSLCADGILGKTGQSVDTRMFILSGQGERLAELGAFEATIKDNGFAVRDSRVPKVNAQGANAAWVDFDRQTVHVVRGSELQDIPVETREIIRDVFLNPNGEIWVNVGDETDFLVLDVEGRFIRRESEPFFPFVDFRLPASERLQTKGER